MVPEFQSTLNESNPQYDRIIRNITTLQAQDPDEQTNSTFALIRERPELREHEAELRAAHDDMVAEHEGSYRRLSGHPYQVHPDQVAHTVVYLLDLLGKPVTVTTFEAALHHDVWEDGKTKNVEKVVTGPDLTVAHLIDSVTRHPTQTDDNQLVPIDHDQAAEKVRIAHATGVEDAIVLKTSDRLVNVLDQPGVCQPPDEEQLIYANTEEYRRSPYGKWRRLKQRTEGSFTRILLHDQPELRGVLFAGIAHTQEEIDKRPRKSFRT